MVVGALTVGSIVIYVDYVRRLQNLLNLVSRESDRLMDIKHGLYRLMSIYNSLPDIEEEGAKSLKKWNKIKIKNLDFKYNEGGILNNLNLEIKKGEKIGIVGKSGCGKSTLFKLLLKLYLPQQGDIYFNNKPIEEVKRESLLKKISVVPQETELFNFSLKENILFSNPKKFNFRRYAEALKISQTDKIVSKLKQGDKTLVGEKGVRLSGGEKQRIGIARALYRDSEIIIFDETTSNLDYETERKIMKNFSKKLKNKTLIISAHRLSTLKEMDKIVYMEKGKIIESGTYSELIKKKGKFYSLWKEQESKSK